MAQPQAYNREVDFTERDGDDTNHAGINAELDAAALSINQIRDNLALIQKDDGGLQNGIVGAEQLAQSAFDAIKVDINEAVNDAQTAAASATLAANTAIAARDDAQASETAAETAADAALLNANTATTKAAEAAASATSAATSASTATTKAGEASTSATNAATSATAAAGSATTASTQATNAANSATAAATSASNAATSASTATTQAGIATTQAGNAAASATAAAASFADFNDRYLGAKSTAPTVDNDGNPLQVGTLYYDTTLDQMRVYTPTGWGSASSSVNGTSARFRYIATAGQATFTGTDSNGNTLSYDAGFVDVYLNGQRLDQTDYTASSGTSIVLTSAAAVGDELNIVAFGTFVLANLNAGQVAATDGAGGSLFTTVEGALDHLSSPAGAAYVGFDWAALPAAMNNIEWGVQTSRNGVNALRYVPPAEWPAILAGTSTYDVGPVIQSAIYGGVKNLYFPAGRWYSSVSIKLPHTGSYFRRDTGITIQGDGIYTILTRNNVTDVATSDENLWYQRSFFSVYGSNNIIENVQFYGCPIAIYFGQDPAKIGIELSHTSFNRVRNLLIQNCGTGILSACAQGHYYNHYEAIHIAQSQIGVHFTTHSVWGSTISNNNRNTFVNVRAARCQVGFWLANGDTNSVYSFHCEGCGTTPTNNSYSTPAGLPGGLTTAAQIVMSDNNSFINCFHEACDFYLYQAGLYNNYLGCLYRVNEEPAKSTFVTPAYQWLSRSETWLSGGAFASVSNTNANAFPDTPAGAAVVRGTTRFVPIDGGGFDITSGSMAGTYAREQIFQLGAIASAGTASFTLWPEVSAETSSAALFEVSVVGNSQTNSLVHANTFKVIALRNGSRTVTRYYVYDQVIGRASGGNAGDASEPLTPSLSLGGTNGKDLIVTITAPARTFANVSVIARRIYSK